MTGNGHTDPPAGPESERRSHRRIALAVPAEIVVGDEAPTPAALLSLSLGGAALRAEVNVEHRARVTVRFRVIDRGWVDIKGEVVRAAKSSIGVRFLALDPNAFSALLSLLDSATP